MNFLSPKKKKADQATSQLRKLIAATCNGWTNSVTELTRSGADVNVKNESGITPLHIAAVSGNSAMVKTLIKCGADVNCRENNYLSTPLHFAAIKGNVVSVQNLIESNQEIANRGCAIVGDVTTFSDNGNYSTSYEAVILTLVRKGADLNAKDVHGKTPLHLAVHYHSDAVKTLLGLGAEVDPQDNAGRLPWHYAIDHDNVEGLRWLLAFGADVNDFNMFCQFDLDKIKCMLTNQSAVKDLILDQLTRLRAARLFISRVYAAYVYSAEKSQNLYFNQCVTEVRKMEYYEIEDGVSLFHLLHMSPRQKIAYTRASDRTMSMLIKFESEFPNYYGIIRASFLDEKKRKPLIDAAKSAWYHLTNISLPDICVEHILSYLNSCCLKIMIEGAKNCEALK